jgi:predicted  nucleic acid-binding Zn-ribbon protein
MAVCNTFETQQQPKATGGLGLFCGPVTDVGEMTLRVHGPGQEPRVVRIRSPKCTVGSAPGCTLRVRAAGVGRLHCWILRGSHGTVVRRLHGAAMLNGGQFDEALLTPGDRLRVGSVELEIVECNGRIVAPLPAIESAAGHSTGPSELQSKLDDALAQIQHLQSESRQAFQSSIVAAERADQLHGALDSANDQLEDLHGELETARENIASKATQIEDLQRQISALKDSENGQTAFAEKVRNDAAAASRQCEQLRAELAGCQSEIANDRQCWEAEKAELLRQIGKQKTELDAARNGAITQIGAMTVPFDDCSGNEEAKKAEIQAKLAGLEQRLSAKQGEIEALQKIVGERVEVQHRLDQLTTEYDAKCRELEEVRRQLSAASDAASTANHDLEERTDALTRWQQELADREAAVSEVQRRLADEQAQLAAERDQLAAVQQQREQLGERQSELDRRAAEQDAKLAETASKLSELNDVREQLVAQQALMEEERRQLQEREQEIAVEKQRLQSRVSELDGRESELEARRKSLDESSTLRAVEDSAANATLSPVQGEDSPQEVEAPGGDNPSENPSDSGHVSSVLSRLVKAGLWRNDEPAAGPEGEQPGPILGDEVIAEPVVEPAAEAPKSRVESVRQPSPPHAGAGSEDESIESYMERLMQRVRGDTPVPPSSKKSTPVPIAEKAEPSPQIEQEPGAPEAPTAEQPTHLQTNEFSPRRTAAELGTDMSALRELVNNAARSAIDHHVRKHTGKQAAGRLMGACFIVVISGVLCYWAWKTQSRPATAGALIGVGLGVSWTLASIRRMFKLKRLNNPQAEAATPPSRPAK